MRLPDAHADDPYDRRRSAARVLRECLPGSEPNVLSVTYFGERPELSGAKKLTLEIVKPWLKGWGY